MSFNGAGLFVVNSSGQPVVANTLIEAAVFNAFTADVATGLSTAILKDGTQTVTANIPFGGFRLTGVGAASARTDAATMVNVQDGTGVYVATVGGTADAITLTPSPAITAYAAGQTFRWIASGANTTNVTVAVSGLAAKAVTKNSSTALIANDITSGTIVTATYDGTRFILGTATLGSNSFIGQQKSSAGEFNLKTVTALSDADATLTAAQLITGLFTITPTVARTLTTDTAANIIAALTGYAVGSHFKFTVVNTDAFSVTLAAGAGVTLAGKAIVNNGSGTWRVRIDSASAVTIYTESAAAASTAGLIASDVTGTTQVALTGHEYTLTNVAATAVTAPASATGAEFKVIPANSLKTNTVDFGADTVQGPNGSATGVITLNLGTSMHVKYNATLSKWVMQ